MLRGRFGSAPTELDIVLAVGKGFDIDEALTIYTSKIYVNNWVSLKHKYCSAGNCSHAIQPDNTKRILSEYSRAVLVIGKKQDEFRTAILAMERELVKSGFYKTLAIINGPCDFCSASEKVPETARRPSLELMGIDILATVRKFKKNVEQAKEGEIQPYAIILVE